MRPGRRKESADRTASHVVGATLLSFTAAVAAATNSTAELRESARLDLTDFVSKHPYLVAAADHGDGHIVRGLVVVRELERQRERDRKEHREPQQCNDSLDVTPRTVRSRAPSEWLRSRPWGTGCCRVAVLEELHVGDPSV